MTVWKSCTPRQVQALNTLEQAYHMRDKIAVSNVLLGIDGHSLIGGNQLHATIHLRNMHETSLSQQQVKVAVYGRAPQLPWKVTTRQIEYEWIWINHSW